MAQDARKREVSSENYNLVHVLWQCREKVRWYRHVVIERESWSALGDVCRASAVGGRRCGEARFMKCWYDVEMRWGEIHEVLVCRGIICQNNHFFTVFVGNYPKEKCYPPPPLLLEGNASTNQIYLTCVWVNIALKSSGLTILDALSGSAKFWKRRKEG